MIAAWRVRQLARRTERAYRGIRDAHPATVLRWLRNGMLLGVAAATLMYLWVALAERQGIATVSRTDHVAQSIAKASADARAAQAALVYALDHGGAAPPAEGSADVSDSSSYTARILDASGDLALTAQGSFGPKETADFQPISEDLAVYLELSDTAVTDYDSSPASGQLPAAIAAEQETYVQSALASLQADERATLRVQRDVWSLDPALFWWVLLGPVMAIVLLVAATLRVLASHFRRRPSRWLWVALTTTAATTVTTGLFATSDEQSLSADPWAGHPATITVALLLYAAAATAAYIAYRARLAEYQF
ncbi:MAG TPA: hypothetical protein VN969_28415 [Streptosporangiaceae bacterium]|nr:hypothetical protein [Streptosporangiaceae bacterium]